MNKSEQGKETYQFGMLINPRVNIQYIKRNSTPFFQAGSNLTKW